MSTHARPTAAEPIGPAPARPRLLAQVRRSALAVMLGLLGLAALISWGLASLVAGRVLDGSGASPGTTGELIGTLGVAQLVVFGVLGLVAYAVARRSTRVVEEVFSQEDRLMLAVAHEVRTPLSRLLVALEEGISGAIPTELALKEAAVDGATLSELIDDLIETARVISGAMTRPSEAVRVDQVVAGVARSHARGDVHIVVDVVPARMTGSPRLLRLAVSNLVRNSVRHAYKGKGGTIHITVDAGGVTVTDEGDGIPADRLEELRRDIPQGLRRAKSGLGLALAGWACDIHGGHLDLASREPRGLVAQLVLPVELVADEAPGPPRSTSAAPATS